jgi:hypothetical protein
MTEGISDASKQTKAVVAVYNHGTKEQKNTKTKTPKRLVKNAQPLIDSMVSLRSGLVL